MPYDFIFEGGAQSFSFLCEVDGEVKVPDADPTYTIVDLRYGTDGAERTVQASASATLSTVSTTTTAASGPTQANDHKVTVASAVGIKEGDFLLLAKGQRDHVFIVDKIDSSDLYSLQPIPKDFASGATVVGVSSTGSFPSAEAADEDRLDSGGGPYAIEVVFVVDSVTHRRREIGFVKRTADKVWAYAHDVWRIDQTLQAQTKGQIWRVDVGLVNAHDRVRDDLRAKSLAPERVDAYALRRVVALACASDGRRQIGEHQMADHWDSQYQSTFNSVTQGVLPEGTVITNDDDEADDGTTAQRLRKFQLL